jgi:plastocyanin
MKNTYIVLGVVVLVVISGVLISKNSKVDESKETENTNQTQNNVREDNSAVSVDNLNVSDNNQTSSPEVAPFIVNGGNFYFKPNIIKVKEGDTVTILFKNEGGMHNLIIDEYKVGTQVITDGAEETITFKADKKGSFEYYCSVGKHREMGMKGTLIVE